MSPTTTRHAEPDQACADAVDLARAAAEADAGAGQVGSHVGVEVEGDRIVTHLFACLSPAYVGWRWAVTVSRASRSKVVTVSETALLPGPDSLLAPDWVPWTERVRPGDLKAGDLMPAGSDDERLVPVVAIAGEVGLLDWDESNAWTLAAAAGADIAGEPGEPGTDADDAADADADRSPAAGPESGTSGTGTSDTGMSDTGTSGTRTSDTGTSDTGKSATGKSATGKSETGARDGDGQEGSGETENGHRLAGQPGGRSAAGSRTRMRRRSGSSRVRDRAPGVLRPARTLSAVGRDEAALRWYAGEQGPRSALASTAPATCLTCGFMVRLSGPLGTVFGVCANEFAPDDGKVVSVDHGCGAHSDGEAAADVAGSGLVAPKIDELGYDMLNTGATVPDSVLETLDHEQL